MTQRSGSADLPLHGGRVPAWLGERMTRLGAVISQAIVHHYGRDELLRRLAHPFWFQSFGAVMGMDWHSSGITTSVIGALKRGLQPLQGEIGIHVCGGRGRHSRKTPQELIAVGERVGIDGERLATASRLVAKVDSAAVQDGFDLAHGGKDRHPYPVPLKVYDETIRVLKSAVQSAKLGRDEELGALKRLDDQARAVERFAEGPSVQDVIAQERERSHLYGGRSVFGFEPPPGRPAKLA
jgi:hypothetical protein